MKSLSAESFHTVLFCRKWDACVAFYRDILGFEVVDAKPGFVEFEVAPGSRIGLLKPAGDVASEYSDASFILSFRVGNVDEIHRTLSERCEGLTGVKSHSWGARLFELRDPEGRRLEFWTPQ
jgi:catechol 2,3-dioxygenase-like lactoylglutathione lyase family enzyme